MDALRTHLRSQSEDLDYLEAENAEQRAIIKTLRIETAHFQTAQKEDARDLLHLAGRLLTISQSKGVNLDNTSKALFRLRGWTAASRNPDGQKQ